MEIEKRGPVWVFRKDDVKITFSKITNRIRIIERDTVTGSERIAFDNKNANMVNALAKANAR